MAEKDEKAKGQDKRSVGQSEVDGGVRCGACKHWLPHWHTKRLGRCLDDDVTDKLLAEDSTSGGILFDETFGCIFGEKNI
jgi:hypothetical protein